ncbi:MAG: DUF4422 domain-containing protein [Pseudomonadota bacterium]
MTISIYSAYHAAAPLIQSRAIRPIHVGRARAARPLDPVLAPMLGDDSADNISKRNPEFCELTALYWAWKNDAEAQWLGLMHYRRVFDFTGTTAAAEGTRQAELFPGRFDVASWCAETEDWLAESLNHFDLVVPPPHVMGHSVASNYTKRHAPGDWEATRAIIARDHPEYLTSFDYVATGPEILLGNMMLMRKPLANRYCAWLFDILFKLEAVDLDRSLYDPRQRRYLGFVAERLLTVFVHHLSRTEPGIRIHRAAIINMKDAAVFPMITGEHLNGPEHINVAFAADQAYVPHAAAMVRSMLDHAAPERQINLFFLQTDVPNYDLELLASVVATRPNTTLYPIAVDQAFKGSYRSPSRAPSNATYNRFLLFDLLPGLNRLLYIDVDMILLGDVAEIFDWDMGNAPLAAVTDYIMTRVLTGPTPTVDPAVPDLGNYYRNDLGLTEAQILGYFNAGLLLFQFAALDTAKTGRDLIEMARTGKYLFRDQDILNVYFKNDVLHLPGRYNVFNTVREGYGRVPQANYEAAMEARRNPMVIHYAAGDYKPWKRPVLLGEHYWQALLRTPFYARILTSHARGPAAQRQSLSLARLVATGRSLADRVPALRPALLWTYRQLRRIIG